MSRWMIRVVAGVLLWAGVVGAEEVLPTVAERVRPVLVGTEAPGGMLKMGDGSAFDLGAAMAEKPTILVFYRGIW